MASSLVMGGNVRVSGLIPQVDLLAPTARDLSSPASGGVKEFGAVIQSAVTTGGTLTLSIGGVAVAGGVITVPNGATKGTVIKAALTAHDLTRGVNKDDVLLVTPAGFATAGAVDVWVDVNTGGADQA